MTGKITRPIKVGPNPSLSLLTPHASLTIISTGQAFTLDRAHIDSNFEYTSLYDLD